VKHARLLSVVTALLWTASAAWAQSGFRSSTGVVRLPPVESEGSVERDDPGRSLDWYQAASAQFVPPTTTSFPHFPQSYGPGGVSQASLPHAGPPTQPASFPPPTQPPSTEPPRRDLGESYSPMPERATYQVANPTLGELGYDSLPPWGPEPGREPAGESDRWSGYQACGVDYADSCLPRFQPRWYVSVSGLVMARGDKPNEVAVTHEAGNEGNVLMHTQNDLPWRAGGEIRIGRFFGCGAWVIEAAYWTLDPLTSVDSQTHPNLVSTPLDFSDVEWADRQLPGFPGNLFDVAEEHRVWRRNQVHNVELTLINDPPCHLSRGPFEVGWSAGVRYFRFEEDLRFGSMDQNGLAFGIDTDMEGYLDETIVNDLVGVQFGWCLDYCRDRWQLYAFPKAGVCINHIRNRFSAYRGDEELLAPVPAGYPFYPVNSTRDVFALLTEIDVGLRWQFATKWRATVGYRVTIATGMGLADDQIPVSVGDTPELADIDFNGHLLLHGARADVTCWF
jgi:hypothetical protein